MSTKVLFFSHDAKLGDAIVNTAFVAGLKRHTPASEIHATVAGITAGFWGDDSRIAKTWKLQKPRWRDVLRLGLALRAERYDYIVTWHRMRSEKNRLLLWLANAREVIDLHEFNQSGVTHKIDACGAALARMNRHPGGQLAYDLDAEVGCEQLDTRFPASEQVLVVNLFAADAERNVGHQDAVAMVLGLNEAAPAATVCLVCTNATEAAARAVLQQCGARVQLVNCEVGSSRVDLQACKLEYSIVSPK